MEMDMREAAPASKQALPESAASVLRLLRPASPLVALGLAVKHLMVKPAFAVQPFGAWSRILVGQINRGHYLFAVDPDNRVCGFMGWALTSKEKADEWFEGGRDISCDDSLAGDSVILNAWSADHSRAHRFLVDEARKMFQNKRMVYFRRHYRDGRMRSARLDVSDSVAVHAGSKAASSGGES